MMVCLHKYLHMSGAELLKSLAAVADAPTMSLCQPLHNFHFLNWDPNAEDRQDQLDEQDEMNQDDTLMNESVDFNCFSAYISVLQFGTPAVRRNTSIIEPLDKFAARLADNLHVADVHDDDYDVVNAVGGWWLF